MEPRFNITTMRTALALKDKYREELTAANKAIVALANVLDIYAMSDAPKFAMDILKGLAPAIEKARGG